MRITHFKTKKREENANKNATAVPHLRGSSR